MTPPPKTPRRFQKFTAIHVGGRHHFIPPFISREAVSMACNDPGMGAASAQVFIHAVDDFLPRRGGIVSQQAVRFEDHAGCTIAALETDMLG